MTPAPAHADDLGRTDAAAVASAAVLAGELDRLAEAAPALRAMAVADRIAAIDRAAARWLAPTAPSRRRAISEGAACTGYAPAAVAIALDNLWGALRAAELRAVVRGEGVEEAIERGGAVRLAVHVLAGNVPGAGVFGMVAALVAGVPSLVKTARREPLIPELVARTLAAEDPRLGAALAVVHWPGGASALDALALAPADLVLAYGRAATLEAIAAHRPRRLLRFGPRLSAALVAREACDPATAARAAGEVALFDQQGCLSPQLMLVEEADGARTAGFAEALADALAALAVTLPRAPLSLAEAAATSRFLEHQRWRAQEGADLRVYADPTAGFSVVCDRTGSPSASPLNRHVVLVPVPTLAAAGAVLRPLAGMVEAVGYAGPEHRLGEAAAVAAGCRAQRLCPLERMQAPPFAWRQSGYPRLAAFLAA